MEGGAALAGNGVHAGDGVEGLGGVDYAAAVGDGCEEAEREAEAVEERGWAAEGVGGGEAHAVADEAGVVDEVAGGC